MSPQQGTMGQNRSDSLTGESKALTDNKKKMKTLAQRRQSAPSLVISKALTRSRSTSRYELRHMQPSSMRKSCYGTDIIVGL
ncbi:rho GTPase-activating protein 20-like [Lates japonicus]